MTRIITERLLFAAHHGTAGSRAASIILDGHCLPIACSHRSWGNDGAENGFEALWDSLTECEEFFERIGIDSIEADEATGDPGGLWVYEVEYSEPTPTDVEAAADDDEDWRWLAGGTLRRPTAVELDPLTRGRAPWSGVLL